MPAGRPDPGSGLAADEQEHQGGGTPARWFFGNEALVHKGLFPNEVRMVLGDRETHEVVVLPRTTPEVIDHVTDQLSLGHLTANDPEVNAIIERFAAWLAEYPDKEVIDPRELARAWLDVRPEALAAALSFLVHKECLRQV